MKASYKVLIVILLIIAGFGLLWQSPEFRFVITGKIAETTPTTANVTISGFIGDIVVSAPLLINFTVVGTSGLQPATSYNPKNNTFAYITVNLNATSNSAYDLYINATNLVSLTGKIIPVANISVNSSCNASETAPHTLHRLSTSFISVCGGTSGEQSVTIYSSANIYFYLDIPAGQYNDTYNGSIWIYANYSGIASNSTWYGPWNTTALVRKYIEVTWNSSSSPISFGSLAPGSSSNATDSTFPADVISGAATNVYIDWYINGTDLTTGVYTILAGNLTYANASTKATWPSSITKLNNTLPASPTPYGGNFPNWGNVGNASNTWVWFNISIPPGQQAGTYVGNLTGKAVEKGEDPTP